MCHKNSFVSFNVSTGISPWQGVIKFVATKVVHAFFYLCPGDEQNKQNFHSPKLHQKMLIPIDNFLCLGYQRNGKYG